MEKTDNGCEGHMDRHNGNKTKAVTEQDVELAAEERRLNRNAEILRMMPDNIADALAKARSKPVWCSDVRWRMELGRRRYARYS